MREPRKGRVPDYVPEVRPKYIGAYEVYQVYGGPEEGGWWYTHSIHISSMMLRHDDDILTVARALWNEYENKDDGREVTSVLADNAVFVYFENTPGEWHDNERQYFE